MKQKLWTMDKADEYFSKWIRERDPFCFFCHVNPSRQNSHFWGRGNKATRYDPLNCDGVCGGCHMDNEGSKQGLYRDLKIKQLGKKGYEALEKRGRSIMKLSDAIAEVMSWCPVPQKKVIS